MERVLYGKVNKMKLRIEGSEITKKDLLEIGKFMANYFANRKDFISFFIEEGTQDMNMQECESLFNKMFEGKEHFVTKIHIKEDKKIGEEGNI